MKQIVFYFIIIVLMSSGCASLTGRTAGEIIDDSTITSAINVKIIQDPELKYLKINVDSFRGHVTLTGTVPNKRAEDRLVEIAKSVKGVKSVKTNLIIEK